MPGLYSSHGTTVSFNGVPIGYLTGFDWEAAAGEVHETTHVGSSVFGTGANARVVKEYDATSIEPPVLNIVFWGPPSFAATDAGLKAQIVFDAPGAYLSGEAILTRFNHAGRSGQWSTGTASFQMTGDLSS
jgi:hypothetical protein